MSALLNSLRPGDQFTRFFVTLSLAVVLIWFGLMNISGASDPVVNRWLKGHMFLSGLRENRQWIMMTLGALQALSGLVIILHSVPDNIKRHAYHFVLVWSVGSLSLLFTNPVWIDALGGFPAIGAGQGIIKYLAIAGLAMWSLGHRHAKPVMLAGLILVLGWIGGMKFTMVEADGIEPLLKTSPVFNWWLTVYFTKMQASYVIGIMELMTVLLLTGYWWNSRLFDLGLLLSAVTFIVTLSFMLTFGPTWTAAGFPYLSSSGQFLLKDLLLLAATFALAGKNRT